MGGMKQITTEDVVDGESPHTDSACTILLVDDEKLARIVAKRRLESFNYRILEATNGEEALGILEREKVDLILSEWMMPRLDGPGLCEAIKRHERYKTIHFILMTAFDLPEQIAEGLRRGADDFLPKSASDQEIISRVRGGLRARKLMLDLEEANRLLLQKQAELHSELRSASNFVRGLLPRPGELVPGLRFEWKFLPSSHLGGDLFQVARWGDDHIGLMMLDMSGHGIGPALRAVSLALLFNGDHIQKTFPSYDPGEIVTFLNQKHPMTDDGDYFTIWVGVWQCSTHLLRYASAGHPGSILVKSDGASAVLGGQSWPIGFSLEGAYRTESITVHAGDRLYLFSDGIYEVMNSHGEIWGRKRLQEALEGVVHQEMMWGLTNILEKSCAWNVQEVFGDDVALLGLEFQGEGVRSKA
ncbi:MAG: SpoIIE family protein phosphatase [Nitrospirota bacterium]|nr:SpoIIE family protein phosphatase [Nitrospirota bacterium]MDH4360293.1 SpoIIE family protein phosphatase [Nitrospirota bacterium]MDH5295616.1 SpoIIE family protein phosphatase [Nitrospirota bacterium]